MRLVDLGTVRERRRAEEDRERRRREMPEERELSKILRYEAHLTRQLNKTIYQLLRVQQARNGGLTSGGKPPKLPNEVNLGGAHFGDLDLENSLFVS